MAEKRARKRRQRAGHRSSAKRIISSVTDVLGGRDISQVREYEIKQKQQKESLQQRLNTLRQLDTEILALWPKKKSKVKVRKGERVYSEQRQPSPQEQKRREGGTTHALLTGGDANCPTCTFCEGKHPSRDCQTVPDVQARKNLLKKYGRCFVCLGNDHISRNCSAMFKCHNCKDRRHVSICLANPSPLQPTNPVTPVPTPAPQQNCLTAHNSVVFHTDSTTPLFI